MESEYDAVYEFGVSYQNVYSSYFEDCQDNYQGNKNLYAMYLPPACKLLANIRPTTSLSLSSTSWNTTDLSYSFTLSRDSHIIVRYQYTPEGSRSYTILVLQLIQLQ